MFQQELLRAGMPCWVLHPRNGNRPVAERIIGSTPPPRSAEPDTHRSLLTELREDEQQTVKITKVHKKNTDLMIPQANSSSMYLDDFVVPPAPADTYVTWHTVYLDYKIDEP